MSLKTQIHLITNSFGGGRNQAEALLILFRDRLSNEKIRHVTRPLKKTSCIVPAFIQFRLEFGEHKHLLTCH
jgi:hypothetical protein